MPQVIRFLECVCHKVVPKELWGCPHNKRTFLRNLAKFLRLHRGEKFSLGQVMEGIKVSKCEWLKMKAEDKGSLGYLYTMPWILDTSYWISNSKSLVVFRTP